MVLRLTPIICVSSLRRTSRCRLSGVVLPPVFSRSTEARAARTRESRNFASSDRNRLISCAAQARSWISSPTVRDPASSISSSSTSRITSIPHTPIADASQAPRRPLKSRLKGPLYVRRHLAFSPRCTRTGSSRLTDSCLFHGGVGDRHQPVRRHLSDPHAPLALHFNRRRKRIQVAHRSPE